MDSSLDTIRERIEAARARLVRRFALIALALAALVAGVLFTLASGCRSAREQAEEWIEDLQDETSTSTSTSTSTTTSTTQPPEALPDTASYQHGPWVAVDTPILEAGHEGQRTVNHYREDGFVWQMERGCELAAPVALERMGHGQEVPLRVLGTQTKVLAWWSAQGDDARVTDARTGAPARAARISRHECYVLMQSGRVYRFLWSYDHKRDTLPETKNDLGQGCLPGNYWFGTGQSWIQLDQYGGNQSVCERWAIRRPARTLFLDRLSPEERAQAERGRGN